MRSWQVALPASAVVPVSDLGKHPPQMRPQPNALRVVKALERPKRLDRLAAELVLALLSSGSIKGAVMRRLGRGGEVEHGGTSGGGGYRMAPAPRISGRATRLKVLGLVEHLRPASAYRGRPSSAQRTRPVSRSITRRLPSKG
jgi:hypothetical protein